MIIANQTGRPPLIQVLVDRTTTLFCRTTALPPANITWFKDGVRVDRVLSSSDYQLVNGDMELVFLQLEDEYRGLYTCVADNGIGNSSYTVELDVQSE